MSHLSWSFKTRPGAKPVLNSIPAEVERRPLRPSRLVPARRRVNAAIAARLFHVADLVLLLAALTLGGPGLGWSAAYGIAAAAAGALMLGLCGAYEFPRGERLRAHLALVLVIAAASLSVFAALIYGSASRIGGPEVARLAFGAIGVTLLHAGWRSLVVRWRENGLLTPNVVIVGATPTARALINTLIKAGDVNIIGIFDDRASRSPDAVLGIPVLGGLEALVNHRTLPAVDLVVITVPPRAQARIAELLDRLSSAPNQIMLAMDDGDGAERLGHVALRRLDGRRANGWNALSKRAQDVLLAGLALIPLAPVLLLVAAAVKLDTPGPVFFRQRRHGFNNEEFFVWKFRSMRTDAADATAALQVQANDNRVTRIGRFIRRTSLDELPQLFNVLSGEMSLVGPRPHAIGMKSAGQDAARLVDRYAHRHRLKPGLTGWAAVQGSRGPVDDPESLRLRLALDMEYIERQSFWFDLWIMLRTLPLVLGDHGAQR